MRNPLSTLKNQVSEVKGRTIIIVVAIAIILIIAGFFVFRTSEHAIVSGGSSAKTTTLRAPEIESTPGFNKANDQAYIELQKQANVKQAQEAIAQGKSAVATVTGDQFVNELSIPEPGLASIVKSEPGKQPTKSSEQAIAEYQKIYQEQLQREKLQEAQRLREKQLQQEEVYQEAFEGLMQNQIKGLLSQWGGSVTQSYVKSDTSAEEGGVGRGGNQSPGMPPLYKAGDIIFAIMETSVNSDEPGPVLSEVISGPLKGAKLIGSFKRVDAQLFIEFSLLSAPNKDQSLPVKAVAIDPQTARTALSTNVDYHRLLRYSTLFASSFLQGVGDAILAGIQPETWVTGESITISDVSVSTRDAALVGLGEVGTKMGEKLDPLFDRPPTVTLDSGTSIGLLFLQDFYLQPSMGGAGNASASPAIQVVHEDANGNPISTPTNVSVNPASANVTSASATSNTSMGGTK